MAHGPATMYRRFLLAMLLSLPAAQAMAGDHDFDGDGRDDVAWRHANSGANALWRSADPAGASSLTGVTNAQWKIVGAGDFNGDGRADLFWRNRGNGQNTIWLSGNATTQQRVASMNNTNWHVQAVADFDGDGRSDVLWYHERFGRVVWPAANAAEARTLAGAGLFFIVALGDFDGNGRDDVLVSGPSFQVPRYVRYRIWLGGESTNYVDVGEFPGPFRGWQVQGVGDFNGDGRDDVFWRNISAIDGRNIAWLGANPSTTMRIANVPDLGWQVAAVGDYDGDGRDDLFWRHYARGDNAVWPAANGSRGRYVARVSTHWSVVPYEGALARPTVVVADGVMVEGDSGTTTSHLRVQLSHPALLPVHVALWLTDALGGSNPLFADATDFTTAAGMAPAVTIPPGEMIADIPVEVFGDTTPEINERFHLYASSDDGMVVGHYPQVRILNDDANTLWIEGAATFEGNAGVRALTFQVRLSQPAAGPMSCEAQTVQDPGGGATREVDYVPRHAVVAIPQGATAAPFVVYVEGDRVVENQEHFLVDLGNCTAGAEVIVARAYGLIYNYDT